MSKEYMTWSEGNEKKFLEEQGYFNIMLKNGEWTAMFQFAFSVAIVSELHQGGYNQRWCYHSPIVALQEFEKWDGKGEPQNWHRHIPSMRRRDEDNNDIGEW